MVFHGHGLPRTDKGGEDEQQGLVTRSHQDRIGIRAQSSKTVEILRKRKAEPLFAAAVPVTGKSVAVLQRFPQTAFPELHVKQLRVDGIGLQIPAGFRCRRPGFGFRLQGRQARGDVAHKRAGLRDTADESFILQKRKSMLDSGL